MLPENKRRTRERTVRHVIPGEHHCMILSGQDIVFFGRVKASVGLVILVLVQGGASQVFYVLRVHGGF